MTLTDICCLACVAVLVCFGGWLWLVVGGGGCCLFSLGCYVLPCVAVCSLFIAGCWLVCLGNLGLLFVRCHLLVCYLVSAV